MLVNIKVASIKNGCVRATVNELGSFPVQYIRTSSKDSYTAYDDTPGKELLVVGAELTIKFKYNPNASGVYKNCVWIKPKMELTPSMRMVDAMEDVAELLAKQTQMDMAGRKFVTRSSPVVSDNHSNVNNVRSVNNTSNPPPADVSEEELFGNDGKNDELPF